MRFLFSPAVMLGVSALFLTAPSFVSNVHLQAATLVNSIPVAVTAFSLSQTYRIYHEESILSLVIQSFIFTFPLFVMWIAIVQPTFPV
jgi:predicted permease